MFAHDTGPRAFVFVILPFRDEFRDLFELSIKPACEACGVYCESVEEQVFVGDILDRIYNQIAKADIVIAVATGKNPNVFYEIGYAHALNKRVILLTDVADDIPFDLKHAPHLIYGGQLSRLRPQIEARIHWCLANPETPLSTVDVGIEPYLNGSRLDALRSSRVIVGSSYWDSRTQGSRRWNEVILQEAVAASSSGLILSLGLHNASNLVANLDNYRIAIITPASRPLLPLATVGSATRLPDGRYRFAIRFTEVDRLFPDEWTSAEIVLVGDFPAPEPTNEIEIVVRAATPVGSRDHAVTLQIGSDARETEVVA